MKKGSKATKPYKKEIQKRIPRGNTLPQELPDILVSGLINLNLSTEQLSEIKRRRTAEQSRTQISREMNIQKLYVNRILELTS